MGFENGNKENFAEDGEERIETIAQKIRDEFVHSLDGKEFVITNDTTRKEYKVTGTKLIDSVMGWPLVREEGSQHATVAATESVMKSPEGMIILHELLAQENLSADDYAAVLKKLEL